MFTQARYQKAACFTGGFHLGRSSYSTNTSAACPPSPANEQQAPLFQGAVGHRREPACLHPSAEPHWFSAAGNLAPYVFGDQSHSTNNEQSQQKINELRTTNHPCKWSWDYQCLWTASTTAASRTAYNGATKPMWNNASCENLSGTEPLAQDFKPQRQEQRIQIWSGNHMPTLAKKNGE